MALDPITTGMATADDVLKLVLQLQAEKNTPEMIKAKIAAYQQALIDKIRYDIASENTAEVMKDIS